MRWSAPAALAAALAVVLGAAAPAATLQRLQVPPGASAQLSDGSQRDIAQLAAQAFGAQNTSGGESPTGTWCCVPVWNGRPGGEVWASVTGLLRSESLYATSDPACGAGTCGFPIAAAAFVSLCPGTLACPTGGGPPGANVTASGAANQTLPGAGGGLGPVPAATPSPSPRAAPAAAPPSPPPWQGHVDALDGSGQLPSGVPAADPPQPVVPQPGVPQPSAPAGTNVQPVGAQTPGDGLKLNVTVLPPGPAAASATGSRSAPFAWPWLLVAAAGTVALHA